MSAPEPGGNYAAYAPPAADEAHAPVGKRAALGNQDAITLALTLILALEIILQGSNGIVCLLLATGAMGDAVSFLVMVSHSVVSVRPYVYVIGIGVFIAFLVSANKHAHAFAHAYERTETLEPGRAMSLESQRRRQVFEYTPASMGWWFFIPFMNFVKPYQAVLAVWYASVPRSVGPHAARSDLVSAWWATWLGSILVVNLSGLVLKSRFEVRDLALAVSSFLSLAACVVALRVVRTLHMRQGMCAAEIAE